MSTSNFPSDQVNPSANAGDGGGVLGGNDIDAKEMLSRLAQAEAALEGNVTDAGSNTSQPSIPKPSIPTPIGAKSHPVDGSFTATSLAASRIEAQQFTMLWHPLLTALANAADRSIAAEQCVKQFSQMLPEHTIRLGWSNARGAKDEASAWTLDRLYDSRLGWLGEDNSVYQALSGGFKKEIESERPVRWDSANLLLELRDSAHGDSRAVVWIRPPQANDAELKQFERVIPAQVLATIAAVFFSRPISGRWERNLALARRWWSRRASIGIAALLLIAVACIPVDYRVDAKATVTAMNARRVAAPIDATLLIAHKRPGDLVKQGEPLLELDGRPLRIELEALTAEIDEASKDEDISLAHGEIAQAQLAGLRRQTLSRRRDLIVDRLDKLIVTSPIDGVVIQGDLQHSLGTPLEIGQTLLEIAPSDSVEIELEVPEVEIGYVDTDSEVRLWFPALGSSGFHTHVANVYPSATIRDDQNVFIAKTPMPVGDVAVGDVAIGSVDPTPLRVGMQGEAVVKGPMRPWIWKWVRLPIRRLGWIVGW